MPRPEMGAVRDKRDTPTGCVTHCHASPLRSVTFVTLCHGLSRLSRTANLHSSGGQIR